MDEDSATNFKEERSKNSAYNINRKIFVGNVSYRIRSHKLKKFFRKFGPVEHSYIVKDHLKGWSRGIAFVTFKDEASMNKALQATEEELVLDDRFMRVKQAELSTKTTFWQDASSSEESEEDDWDASCDSTNQSNQSILSCDDQRMDQSEYINGVHINDLFDELLIQIFSLLSFKERVGVERVCHRWKKVVEQSWFSFKSLSFRNFFKQFGGLTDRNLNSALQRCGQYLESLDLSGSPRLLTDFSMNVIGKYCPGLRELDISSVKITDISLKNLVSKCDRLQKVKLKRCIHITENKGVEPFLQGSLALEHIDLSHNMQITGEVFKVAKSTLKSVILSKCFALCDKGTSFLAQNSPNLEEFNLSGCKALTCEGLKNIVQSFTAMKILNISAANISNPASAFRGPVCLTNLEHADFSQNADFGDTCLKAIAQNCPKLRYLDISGCSQLTDRGLLILVCLQHLQTLNVSFLTSHEQIENSLVKIAERGNLIKLTARASPFLTNEGVLRIVASSPHLEYLDLCECFNITNKIFEGFKNSTLDEGSTIELYLGGTSVDWVGDDIDWVSGFSHLKVSMMNLGLYQMRADRDQIITEQDNQSDEDNDYAPHPPISDYFQEGPMESFDDWEEDYDGYDEYLENDDPLAAERWNMS